VARGCAERSGRKRSGAHRVPIKSRTGGTTLDLRPELLSSESESEKALDLERLMVNLMGDDGAG
jgi:hypothetical protein